MITERIANMTPQEIDEMQAGLEMDTLVSELVFDGKGKRLSSLGGSHSRAPFYSTDMTDTWLVVNNMVQIATCNKFAANLSATISERIGYKGTIAWPYAMFYMTPVDICRAALKTVAEMRPSIKTMRVTITLPNGTKQEIDASDVEVTWK